MGTPHWADQFGERIFRDERSDVEIASQVRMLCRSDLMHEKIVVDARDRIAKLSLLTHDLLEAAIAAERCLEVAIRAGLRFDPETTEEIVRNHVTLKPLREAIAKARGLKDAH